jgi:hypothetical protein
MVYEGVCDVLAVVLDDALERHLGLHLVHLKNRHTSIDRQKEDTRGQSLHPLRR